MKNNSAPSEILRKTLKQIAPAFDVEAYETVIACVKAQEGDGVPVWMNLNAPPSSGKTVILDSFPVRPLPNPDDIVRGGILVLDSITPRTLISGLATANKPGLLERIESCALLIKDLAPMASNGEARLVFSQLRRVFDGELSMPFGSGKSFTWNGRMTVICASVSDLSSMDAELGARLLSISLRPIPFYRELAEQKGELRRTVTKVLRAMPKPHVVEKMYEMAIPLSQAVARLRTYVERNWKEYDVHNVPVSEQSHRLANQLAALSSGLVALRNSTIEDTIPTLKRVCVESIPTYRRHALRAIQQRGALTLEQLRRAMSESMEWNISRATVQRVVSDLNVIRLVELDDFEEGLVGRPAMRIGKGEDWDMIECLIESL
jgi:hypothetical protein